MENYKLTPSQWKVIDFPYNASSTLKIIAGPGSGKTLTLLHKIHYLIQSGQLRPNEVLVLSLTNKAVDNIIDNLLSIFELNNVEEHPPAILKKLVEQIGVYTIHGLANRVVVENEGLITIIEENGWRGLLKLLPTDFWQNRRLNSNGLTRELQAALNEFKSKNAISKNNKSTKKQDEVIEKLVTIMNNGKVLTNDDLILRATEYLSRIATPSTIENEISEESFTQALKSKYKVILIDEYQDLYPSLLPIIQKVSSEKQLIMFGDTNQSIYGFLGDNSEVITALDKLHLTNSQTLHLYDNFRCTPEIINSANRILSNHHQGHSTAEDLVLKKPSGVAPQIHEFVDPLDELEFLVDNITQSVCSSAKFSDIAILSRTNKHIQTISEHLTSYGIPFEKLTVQPDWLSDTRIQFIIDLLKVALLSFKGEHAEDRMEKLEYKWQSDFNVIVTLSAIKGIGNKSIQMLYSACNARKCSLWEYISCVSKEEWPSTVSNKKKVENYTSLLKPLIKDGKICDLDEPSILLKEIVSIINDLDYDPLKFQTTKDMEIFKKNLGEMFKIMKLSKSNQPQDHPIFVEWFLETYFDQSLIFHRAKLESELDDGSLGSVKLSTIHSSKGLEFPIVYLAGGPMGLSYPIEDKSLYVGMTRARNLLYLLNTKHGRLGEPTNKSMSPLLNNEPFWNYYNLDMKRIHANPSRLFNSNIIRYNKIGGKFGLGKRTFMTYLRPTFKLCKYLL